jgi:hypothetical protein
VRYPMISSCKKKRMLLAILGSVSLTLISWYSFPYLGKSLKISYVHNNEIVYKGEVLKVLDPECVISHDPEFKKITAFCPTDIAHKYVTYRWEEGVLKEQL